MRFSPSGRESQLRAAARAAAADARIALRRATRDWMFTTTAVATLALGIGATVATFGIVRGVLLRPLPVRDQGHLIVLSAKSRSLGSSHVGLPNGVLWDFAAQSRTASEVTAIPAFAPATPFVAHDGSRTIHLALTTTTGNFFDVLGVRAGRGRLLNAGDDTRPNESAIVLSNTAWMREFGGDTGVATGGEIRRLVLREGARLVAGGVALGVVASLAVSGLFRTLVFGVPYIDPVTLASATLLLVITMAVAVMAPAVRASRLDPMITLRAP